MILKNGYSCKTIFRRNCELLLDSGKMKIVDQKYLWLTDDDTKWSPSRLGKKMYLS